MPYQDSILKINRNLDLLAPGVKRLALLALEDCNKLGLKIKIFEGWRSPDRQLQLLMQNNKLHTKSPPMFSFHQYGLACDIAYFIDDWGWVGDFDKPKEIFMSYGFDAPPSFEECHFQISKNYKIAEIKDLVQKSTLQAMWIALGVDV